MTNTKPEIDKARPPEKIYLQWYGDGDPEIEEPADIDDNDVTWCRDEIFTRDIPYIPQSAADERVREARRETWHKAVLVALDYQRMGIGEFNKKYGTAIMSNALDAARTAAEGGGGE